MKIITAYQSYLSACTIILTALSMTACTNISITMVHTEGQADDVVDEQQSPSTQATVSPVISIPASVLP